MTVRSRNILAVLLILGALCAVLICTGVTEDGYATPTDLKPAEENTGTAEPTEQQPEQPEQPQAEPGTETGEDPENGATGEGELPDGEMPSGGFPGGGMPSGGFPGGGGRGGRGGRGGSSGITPGTALTTAHAAGTGSMLRYGAVLPSAGTDSMQTLVLGGEELALSCGGYSFTASVEEDVLILRSEEGDAWSLTMDVLRTLNISGIRQLVLIGPETETSLDTDLELTGTLYGLERARGFVSADYILLRQDNAWIVQVDGREYRLNGNELC